MQAKTAVILMMIFLTICVFPHPHVFVDLDVYADISDDKLHFYIDWYMDDMFSFNLMSDYDQNGDSTLDTEEISVLSADILPNFSDYDFYTEVSREDKPFNTTPEISVDYSNSLLVFRFKYHFDLKRMKKTLFTISDSEYYHAYYWKKEPTDLKSDNLIIRKVSTDEKKGYSDGFMKQVILDIDKPDEIK